MTNTVIAAISILMAASALPAGAEEPLITDRPDFTESGVTVPRGSVQFEGGFTWERSDDVDVFSAPEGLVRWGVGSRFEVRLGLPDYVNVGGPADASGFGDSSAGFKVALGGDGAWDVAVIASASLPTGDDEFTSDEVDPAVILTAGRGLSDEWSLGAQVQGEWPSAGGDREFIWGGTVVVGRSLSERAGTFLEVAAALPEEGDAAAVLHHGYTFGVTPTFQLDVHGGVGLSDVAVDVFAGAGFAFRL